ncbi:MAG: hypothetical protein ABIJ16_13315, partial [Bacteroidota bacterium]
ILLYIINLIILFKLLERLMKGLNQYLPLLVTLLFMAHPLHTEVVASLKNREEILCYLFALWSVWQVFKFIDGRKWTRILLAVFFFVLAYLSKETSYTFIVIIPLTVYFFSDLQHKKTIIIFLVFFVVAFLLRKIITLNFPGTYESALYENPLIPKTGIVMKLIAVPAVLWFYLKMLIFPHPMGFYYGYNMIPVEEFSYITVISAAIHLFLLVFAIMGLKKKRLSAYAILYYLVSIYIFSNYSLKINGIVGERLVYQASLGFAIILAILIYKLLKTQPGELSIPSKRLKYIFGLVILILLPYTGKTIMRNADWHDHFTLYSADIDHLENSAKANSLIGNWLHQHLNEYSGQEKTKAITDAEKYYKRSLMIDTSDAQVANNLGTIYMLYIHNPDSAIKYFRQCISIDSAYSHAHFNLAQCYELKSMNPEAVSSYKTALKYNPEYTDKISKISINYASSGFFEQAKQLNRILIDVNPGSPVPYYNMANIYVLSGDTAGGLEYAEKSLELDPSNYMLALKTAEFFKALGNEEKADYYLVLAEKFKGKK